MKKVAIFFLYIVIVTGFSLIGCSDDSTELAFKNSVDSDGAINTIIWQSTASEEYVRWEKDDGYDEADDFRDVKHPGDTGVAGFPDGNTERNQQDQSHDLHQFSDGIPDCGLAHAQLRLRRRCGLNSFER